MKVEDIQRANKLVDDLLESLETQQNTLDNIRRSLQEYINFLSDAIKELRDA